MVTITCKRCGKKLVGRTEQDAEAFFDQHECKGKRDLREMPTDLLAKLALGELTEDQAWEIANKR